MGSMIRNLSIRHKLWLVVSVTAGLLVVLWAATFVTARELRQSQEAIRGELAKSGALADAVAYLQQLNAPGNDVLEDWDYQGERAKFADYRTQLNRHDGAVEHLLSSDSSLMAQYDSAKVDIEEMVVRATAVLDLAEVKVNAERAGNVAKTREASDRAAAAMAMMDQSFSRATGRFRDMELSQRTKVAALMAGVTDLNERMLYATLGLTGLALLIVIGLGVSTVRAIAGPINHVAEILQAMAVGQGDLTRRLPTDSKDELGRMAAHWNAFLDQLARIIGDARSGANALSSAASQVAASSQSLSAGTGEQAASVEETTASLEQMNASIAKNADNSRLMEQMAVKGAADAEVSGRTVTQAVEAMKQIAERVTIIEEIAYRTNMLALNAAIEAARAGEQGRGFAVVAAEVRKLAERSQLAAKEIAQVAETNLSVAEKAGQALNELVPAIKKTAELVQDVASASAEQSVGVAQINRAMSQFDQVTQRNAAAAEQLAATATEMAGQAAAVQRLMGFFKLGQEAPFSGTGRSFEPLPELPRGRPTNGTSGHGLEAIVGGENGREWARF